jgi:16S rRNA (cytosine967-C5)-methyltransferase
MNPNIAANQQRLFLAFVAELRPHVRRDSSLPRRIKDLFARHRAIGSRDRKLYRELVYTYLRFLPWIDQLLDSDAATAGKITAWLAPELKPTSAYRTAHCGDWPPVPATLAEKSAVLRSLVGGARPPDALLASATTDPTRPEAGFHNLRSQVSDFRFPPEDLLPEWFRSHCPAAFESPHLDALNSRANIWVRLQVNDRNLVLDEFRAQGWTAEPATDYPDALCLPPNAEVAASDAYRRGFVEIQDLGSQLVLAHAPPVSGRWLDACAGAGGKTLQLARMLGPAGHVDATDIRPDILDELDDRAKRARLTNITIVQKPAESYTGILVDAPCSGSGTWRRQPHLKWYVQPETIAAFTRTQLEILDDNAPRVKPDGLLVYATCSLSHHENHDVVAEFLRTHPTFKSEPPAQDHGGTYDGLGTSLLPGTRNTDGFYVAVLRRT